MSSLLCCCCCARKKTRQSQTQSSRHINPKALDLEAQVPELSSGEISSVSELESIQIQASTGPKTVSAGQTENAAAMVVKRASAENSGNPPPYTANGKQVDLRLDQAPLLDTPAISITGDASSLLVTVTPPRLPCQKGNKRAPVDICAVIDVSGSMNASAPSADGGEAGKPLEDTGLSVLDVVKHAMKTIITTMQEDDRLSLVTFSNSAKVESKFVNTTAKGKETLLAAVERLMPDTSTNLWDGLKQGMNLLSDLQELETAKERLSALFILTDGQPNINPPRGHVPMLQQYLEAHPQADFTISTFGFGYHLDSALMADIARVGGGGYGFIPDSGMVGTVFVHAVANLYATYATKAILNIELPESSTSKKVKPNLKPGAFPIVNTSWGSQIEIGDLQYGQTRDIILEFEDAPSLPELTVSVAYKPWFAQAPLTESQDFVPSASPSKTTDDHKYNLFRCELVRELLSVSQLSAVPAAQTSVLGKAALFFPEMKARISSALPNHENAKALATDLNEVILAVTTPAAFKKWGIHYFPSLARSHQRQQCSNFKDVGLQVYGKDSPLFLKVRDEVDTAFDKLPPPKPSRATSQYNYGRGGGGGGTAFRSAPAPIQNMTRYNNRYGGCYSGDSLITLASGEKLAMDKLIRGMNVATPRGARAVCAVLKTVMPNGVAALCTVKNLKLTPWHPIYHNGSWVFPQDVVEPVLEKCEAVYSVLLQPDADVDAHAVEVGGVRAVTLGHGCVAKSGEEDARVHAFFGDYARIVEGLDGLWTVGTRDGVVLGFGVERGVDGNICGFKSREEAEVSDRVYSLSLNKWQLSTAVCI